MGAGRTADQRVGDRQVNTRKVGEFLALAFGLSWTSGLLLFLTGIEIRTLRGLILTTVLFMWAPAVAAIGVRLYHGDPIRPTTGLQLGSPNWILLAWLAPGGLLAATIAVGTIFPDVTFTTDYEAYLVNTGLTQEQAESAAAQLESFPGSPALVLFGQGLVAGLTINALAALGEEIGWRGLLLTELSPLGFWRLSGITGVVWGIWHAPIILQGHNFPEAPVAGVLVMTVATTAVSPVYTYLTVRAESVLAATFFHGSFNGLGALSLVYLTGGGNLLLSAVGVAGVGAALIVLAICLAHDRLIADESITRGQPLSPWT